MGQGRILYAGRLFFHREPKEEIQFYNAVAKGDVGHVRQNILTQRFMDSEGMGILSKDPLVNIKYTVKNIL